MTAGMAAGAASAVHLQSGVAVMEAEEPMVVSQQLFTLDRGVVYSIQYERFLFGTNSIVCVMFL